MKSIYKVSYRYVPTVQFEYEYFDNRQDAIEYFYKLLNDEKSMNEPQIEIKIAEFSAESKYIAREIITLEK